MSETLKVVPAWRSREGEWGYEQPAPRTPSGPRSDDIMRAMTAAAQICKAAMPDVLRVTFRRGAAKKARDLGTYGAIKFLNVKIGEVSSFFNYAGDTTVIVLLHSIDSKLLADEDLISELDALRERLQTSEGAE